MLKDKDLCFVHLTKTFRSLSIFFVIYYRKWKAKQNVLYSGRDYKDKTFKTFVYCKTIFSGVYTHFDGFFPSSYKFGTVCTLGYRIEVEEFIEKYL